jgi:hypothetical protein
MRPKADLSPVARRGGRSHLAMSVLPSEAVIQGSLRHAGFVPQADLTPSQDQAGGGRTDHRGYPKKAVVRSTSQ